MGINGVLCHDNVTKKMKPKFSFNEKEDFLSWRKQVRDKFIELIGIDAIQENAVPLELHIIEEEQKEDYKQIRFEFESEQGAIVPCYILIPNACKEKTPVVITLQGHNQMGFHSSIGNALCHETLDYDTGRGMFAVQAVREGYIALAIEQRGMGERKASNTFERRVSLDPNGNCYYEAMTALSLGRTILGERCWDISRAIDVLKAFPQCDLDRIAITGNSGGGTAAFYAACYDERIKVCAPSCSFCPYPESIMKFYHCSCNYIPQAYRYFDMQDLTCLIAPRYLEIVAGKYDTAFLVKGVEDGYKTVEKIFAKTNASHNCNLTITSKGHWWCENIMWDVIKKAIGKLS